MIGRVPRHRLGKVATLSLATLPLQRSISTTKNENGQTNNDDNNRTETTKSKWKDKRPAQEPFDLVKTWAMAKESAEASQERLQQLIFSDSRTDQKETDASIVVSDNDNNNKMSNDDDDDVSTSGKASPRDYSSFEDYLRDRLNRASKAIHDANSSSSDDHDYGSSSGNSVVDGIQRRFGWSNSSKDGGSSGNKTQDDKEIQPSTDFGMLAKDFLTIVTGGQESKEKAFQNIIEQAAKTKDRGDISDHQSFSEAMSGMKGDLEELSVSIQNIVGDMDLSKLSGIGLMYFVEAEDELKNPSWKRRMHRFHYGIDIKRITQLNEMLQLANLSYADTVDEISEGVRGANEPMELVYCQMDSTPGKPSHFIAMKKDQNIWDPELEVTMVVRGTKTLTDVITDCIADAVPFKGGKAHSGILKSGQYLVDEHKELFESLLKLAKKRRIRLTIVGHSLGAGAGAIAGMEFHDLPNYNVEVYGFGCPALVSEELSLATKDYITTVVSDSDLVPRMSAASVANVLLDIMEHDWTDTARRDIEFTFEELLRAAPGLLSKSTVNRIMDNVDTMLETYAKPTISPATSERYTPVLFPPGTCVHLYRDGSGISGTIAPCQFFHEIDVTRRMVDDHLIPSGYQQIFLELMRQYYQDQYYRFEDKNEIKR